MPIKINAKDVATKQKIQVQVDRDLALKVNKIFENIGLSTTSAITAFYKRVEIEGGIPFDLKQAEHTNESRKEIDK